MMKKKETIDDSTKNILERVNSEGYNRKDVNSWRYYHNIYRASDYSYFTEVEGRNDTTGETEIYTYPAKFRWIPIQRKNINVLVSNQAIRPFVYSIKINDDQGKKRKLFSTIMGTVDFIFQSYKKREYEIVAVLEQLLMKRQELQQYLSQEPQNEEQAQQIQELKQQLPIMNSQIGQYEDRLNQEKIINNDNIEKLSHYLYDFKDIIEEIAELIAIKLISVNRFQEESTSAFITRTVTGKPYYYVNHEKGKKNVTIKHIDDLTVIYPKYSNIKYIQYGPWCGIKEYWAYEDVIRILGHELTGEEINRLKSVHHTSSSINPVFASTDNDGAMLIQSDNDGISYNGTEESDAIEVIRLWYKKERTIYAKLSPNKYIPERPFVHFITEDYLKRNPVRSDKGESLEKRYIEDRYYGLQVNGSIKIGFELDHIQPRDPNDPSKVFLPIFGETNSSITNAPYSLIQATKDIAEMYNVINYHRELYIAVSGVKGQIVDTSQKPTDMSLAEQRYLRKLGTLYIQTKTKTGRNIGSNYNQWKGYDDSLPSSINQIENILNNLDETLGLIMGVPRQRIGQVVSTDQVGSNEQAVQQSSLVTEILHVKHDELNARVLEAAVNIQLNYLTKPGDILDIHIPEEGITKNFPIPDIPLNGWINIYLENNSKQIKLKGKLEQAAFNEYGRGALPLESLITVFNQDSIKSMEKKLQYFSRKAAELQSNMARSVEEKEIAIAEASKNLAIMLKQEDTKVAMAKLQFDKEKLIKETELKEKELSLKQSTDFTNMGTEREIEAAYLKEQNRASIIDEELKKLQLQLDFLVNLKSIEAHEKAKQLSLDNSKTTKKQVKEKIKD